MGSKDMEEDRIQIGDTMGAREIDMQTGDKGRKEINLSLRVISRKQKLQLRKPKASGQIYLTGCARITILQHRIIKLPRKEHLRKYPLTIVAKMIRSVIDSISYA